MKLVVDVVYVEILVEQGEKIKREKARGWRLGRLDRKLGRVMRIIICRCATIILHEDFNQSKLVS